jgi:hypothetical protein
MVVKRSISEIDFPETARRFSMLKLRPTVPRTPEALAEALALSAADAKEWQVRYELLKRLEGKDHSRGDRQRAARRDVADQGDGNP